MATNRLEEFFSRPHRNSHIEFSRLVPYSSLILTISCVAIFLYRIYMLEPLVKRFTEQYNHLRQDQQRSLINHYVAASIKLLLIFLAVYPSIMIISGRKDLHSPFAGPKVRYGDILLFVFEIFTAMYIFELFYREKISYISGAHHIGAIIITQTSIVLFQDTNHLRDAELEFLLCLVWGKLPLDRPNAFFRLMNDRILRHLCRIVAAHCDDHLPHVAQDTWYSSRHISCDNDSRDSRDYV
jgi:hypothetical protein